LLNPIQIADNGHEASDAVPNADTSGYCLQPGPRARFSIWDILVGPQIIRIYGPK